MKYIAFISLLTIISCSDDFLVKYHVVSDGDFEILYSENIKAEGFGYWTESRYEDTVFIYVFGDSEIDVRVMYIGKRGLTLYNRKIGDGNILIEGKIHDL